jgi:hypothetical protein
MVLLFIMIRFYDKVWMLEDALESLLLEREKLYCLLSLFQNNIRKS